MLLQALLHHFIAICEFKLGLQSESAQIGSKSTILFSHVTLKFDRWPWKTTGPTSGFVHHFVAIGKLKLELQSGNAQFGSKSVIFFSPVWPWNLTDDLQKRYGTSSVCYFKLCASFRSHMWIQGGVTVRQETPNLGKKSTIFLLQALYLIS